MEKMANFGQKNHGLTPLQKSQFFHFLKLLFLQPRNAFFVLEYRKTHFPALYCLKKKRWKKWPILDKKPWVNHLQKSQFFLLFQLAVFIAQKGLFYVLKYRKTHFPALQCLQKIEKWPIMDQNHRLTPARKISIFQLFELLHFIA